MNTLLLGEDVNLFINQESSRYDWEQLSLQPGRFNRLQSPEFVSVWYQFYILEYEPVLCIFRDKINGLRAIMCLAWHRTQKVLTHVGHDNSEYFGWLAQPEVEVEFLRDAFLLLKGKFGIERWSWRWLAPGLDPRVFEVLSNVGMFFQIEKRNSLIWNLQDQRKLKDLKADKALRSKWNRLKRKGILEFRVLREEKETAAALLEVSAYCDFRREAINNVRPFRDNPQKIDFNAALQRYPGTIHVSGIWLNDRNIALHVGIADQQRVCLGITAFDLTEAKNSPGALLMLKLAEELTEKGFYCFDLTPGTDEYKERFANGSEEVYRPVFYLSRKEALLGKFSFLGKRLLRKGLSLVGMDINWLVNLGQDFKSFKSHFRNRSILDWIRVWILSIFSIKEMYMYHWRKLNPNDWEPTEEVLQENQQTDLMLYQDYRPWFIRRHLLEEAISSFSRNERLYSLVQGDRLCFFCWKADNVSSFRPWGFSNPIKLTEECQVLYNFYQASGISTEEMETVQRAILIKAANGVESQPIILVLNADQQLSNNIIQKHEPELIQKITLIQVFSLFKYKVITKVLR